MVDCSMNVDALLLVLSWICYCQRRAYQQLTVYYCCLAPATNNMWHLGAFAKFTGGPLAGKGMAVVTGCW